MIEDRKERNMKQTINIEDTIQNMSLEEKAAFVNGGSFFGMHGFEKLGIPRLQLLDGGTGMNYEQLFGDFYSQEEGAESTNGMVGSTLLTHVIDYYYEPEKLNQEETKVYHWIKEQLDAITGMPDLAPGCFPPGILLGATFDPEIVHRVGQALGLEAAVHHVDILLGSPNVNIHRDPLNGRLFEGYSEDPCVVATLAPELVKGVQEYPVAANVKHFAANNQETNRVGINEVISKRALEEIYLPGFRACVEKGQAQTVMSAYNRINGVPCTESTWLLRDTLRDEWGFHGAVVSDWGAVYHPAQALLGGNDLAMPGPISGKELVEAVQNGELPENVLDEAVGNLLHVINQIQADGKKTNPYKTAEELTRYTDQIAYEAALSGIILLKNENNIFPITGQSNRKVVITGSGRDKLLECGSGSAGITTNRTTSLKEELEEVLGKDRVVIAEQVEWEQVTADTTVIVVASLSGMEGNDRPDMELAEEDRRILEALMEQRECGCKAQSALVLNTCGPVALESYQGALDGIFCVFLPGMQGGKALAHLMTGKANPSGKLPLTFPRRYEDTPTCLNFHNAGYEVHYGEGIYVGYRYYDKKKIAPMYAFGYGLSYTDFVITDVCSDKMKFTDRITVRCKVQNVGETAGAEVVQLYIRDVVSSIAKPEKELKRFAKVYLQPGECEAVTFELEEQDFAYFDMDYDRFLTEEGYYDICIATSSREEDLAGMIRVYKNGESPYSYGLNSTVKVLFEKQELKDALYALWDKEQLDPGIIESNYQYTPNRKLCEIIPTALQDGLEQRPAVQGFLNTVKKIVKE